jgi:UDP-glucose 4-epimerase
MEERMLVTGGAGFLGSHIAERAAAEGYEVTVVDDLSRGTHAAGPFDFVRADVNVAAEVDALAPADAVVHCAALCGVEDCLARPRRVIEDFVGTRNVCRYATRHRVKRLVFLSSGEVYGKEALGIREDDDVLLWNSHEPRTGYALSKLMGEALIRTLEVPHVILRPFNVFGPGQIGPGVVRNFLERALQGEPLQIYNSGRELRAMCYVDDFIEGFFRALVAESPYAVYNLGNPFNAMTVRQIAETVLEVTGSNSGVEYVPKQYPDKRGVTANIDRAATSLGYRPRTSLADGLRATLDHQAMARLVA